MTSPLPYHRRLSYSILRWVLLTALVAGAILSTIQIVLDALRISEELEQRAQQTLLLVEEAATQAIYSVDERLGQQVIDGLRTQTAIRAAEIRHPDGQLLAGHQPEASDAPIRSFADWVFGNPKTYSTALTRSRAGQSTHYGTLHIELDTAGAGRLWLERATVILITGIVRALVLGLVLFLVYHFLLTRPLLRIVRAISRIDPERPADRLIPLPEAHRNNELGIWVRSTNQLLQSIAQSQRKQEATEARISHLARFDHLTGLPNREAFLAQLTSALDEARRQHRMLGVFCCGLDDFKSINEQYGYHLGDQLLEAVAQRLSSKQNDSPITVARLGSDQFVTIQHGMTENFEAASTAERLLQQIVSPANIGGLEIATTATIGVALFPDDATQPEQLLQKAEQSMMLAKTNGSNHFQFYVASIDQEIRDRKQLERDLGKALEAKQFHLVYQPQINMDSHRVVGAEALIRWQHPDRGFIPPDQFIPLAELNHSIVEIGYWVLDEACAQAARWIQKKLPLRIAVNLSAVQLRQPDIVERILAILKKHQVSPQRLELEVTETSFMQNLDDAILKLTQLRNEGILIAVDDFGTGYSSLTYVKRLPVHHLKIDKQFIQDLLVHEDDTRIANTIIDLGRSLNLNVIAEGVETEEQSVYLRNRGCYLAQGYFFSKPVSAGEFEKFVREFATIQPVY